MTIKYCDYINGNDTTGDGSYSLPYKTIDKASTGLIGGDEVRVAKSPDPTALTGTVGFTVGSTAVTGVGTLFTTELAIGDFIKAPDGYYYEVVTLTSNTAAVLAKIYPSPTQNGYSSYKLGVTTTDAAANYYTVVQLISSSGTSYASKLTISGGWDLSTQTKTGETYFRHLNASFASRYGYGLSFNSKQYLEVSNLHFLRYYTGMYIYNANKNVINSPVCCSCGSGGEGISIYSCYNTVVNNPVCLSNSGNGIRVYSGAANTIVSPRLAANGSSGIIFEYNTSNNIISNLLSFYNAAYGISINSGVNHVFYNVTLQKNNYNLYMASNTEAKFFGTYISTGATVDGQYLNNPSMVYVDKYASGNEYFKTYASNGSTIDINNSGAGYSRQHKFSGTTVSQAATAGGTGKEWKLSATNADFNRPDHSHSLRIGVIAVAANSMVTVTCYFKKSNSSSIAGALRCRYGQIAWSDPANDIVVECPGNTSRNQVTLQFTPTEAGVVEIEALAWYVSSTSESVIIDDISISQA